MARSKKPTFANAPSADLPKLMVISTRITREKDIERESVARGRYDASVRRRARHGVIPEHELEAFADDKKRAARMLLAGAKRARAAIEL